MVTVCFYVSITTVLKNSLHQKLQWILRLYNSIEFHTATGWQRGVLTLTSRRGVVARKIMSIETPRREWPFAATVRPWTRPPYPVTQFKRPKSGSTRIHDVITSSPWRRCVPLSRPLPQNIPLQPNHDEFNYSFENAPASGKAPEIEKRYESWIPHSGAKWSMIFFHPVIPE